MPVLEKLLGMLGSSFDGERTNAARRISAMAENKGLSIVELIYGARAQEQRGRQHQKTAAEQPKDDPYGKVMPDSMLRGLA